MAEKMPTKQDPPQLMLTPPPDEPAAGQPAGAGGASGGGGGGGGTWLERFSGMQYRRGSAGFSDAAFSGGLAPPVDLTSTSASTSPRMSLKLPKSAITGLSSGASTPKRNRSFGQTPKETGSGAGADGGGRGGEVTLKEFLDSQRFGDHRGSISTDLHCSFRDDGGGGFDRNDTFSRTHDHLAVPGGQPQRQDYYEQPQDGQVRILSQAVKDVTIVQQPSQQPLSSTKAKALEIVDKKTHHDEDRSHEIFPLDLGEVQEDTKQKPQQQQERARPSWEVGGEPVDGHQQRPVGRLAVYLLNSGLAQNWFFRREDSVEGGRQEEERGGEEEEAAAMKGKTVVKQEKKQVLRELNLWSPQAL